MLNRLLGFSLSTVLVAGLGLTLPAEKASAQQAGQGALALEEVVVTARRREESLQDTPLAISAFTSDEMDLRGHLDITDIASAAPNVNMDSAAATGGLSAAPTVFIRGIGQLDFVINTDPAVGIYVDGVYVARSLGSMLDLIDLERAEVLRGPQGTLFGRNSLAGAVNLISKRPTTDAFDAKLTLAAGEFDYVELGAAFNIPISDRTAARISLMSREQEGFVQALQYDDFWLGSEDKVGVRGQLEFLPTDNLRINLSADYSDYNASPSPFVAETIGSGFGDKTNATPLHPVDEMRAYWWNVGRPMGLPAFSGEPECATQAGMLNNPQCHGEVNNPPGLYATNASWVNERAERIRPEQMIEAQGASATIEWDVGPGTLKSITAYRGFESWFTNDNDYGPHHLFSNVNEDFHQDQRSQELQYVGQALDGKLDYTVGLYAFEETGTEIVTVTGVTALQATMGISGEVFQSIVRDIDNSSDALFAQLTYHFENAPLHLTVGIRDTSDVKSFLLTQHRDFCNRPGNTSNGDGVVTHDKVTDVCGGASGLAEFDETDPMVTLAWDINDTTMAYGTYSTGFRDGGFASRFPDGLPDPIPAFQPEYVSSFEIGAKTTLADGRLQINAAYFMTDYTDMQVTGAPADPMFGGTGVNNVGEASLDGLEVEAFWSITDNFRADFTLGLLDANIESLHGGSLVSGQWTIFPSDQLPYTPETNYTVGLTWRAPLGNGSNITTRLDWIHTDDMKFRLEPHPDIFHPAYDRANISATYNSADARWGLTLGVRNLTDEVYSTAGQIGATNAVSARNVSRPRSAYARFQYFMGN